MYHANGKSQRKGITRSCSPEYGMFSAYPHLPDVLDAKHCGVAVYMHTSHGYVVLVWCFVLGFFLGGGQVVLVCLGVSAVYLIRALSVSSLRSLLQGMEADEVSSEYSFLTVISNHHRIFFP